jgi:hypothetical protein
MEPINDFITRQTTSIFSKIEPKSESMTVGSILPLFVLLVLFGCVGYYGYMYPEKYKAIIGSMLLYFHLGKNNELHATEIPEQSNTYSLLSILGIKPVSKEDLQAY